MKKFKILKEIKPKIRTVGEMKKEKRTPVEKKSNSEFVDDSPISRSRPSGTLEQIESSDSVESQQKFFTSGERESHEEETRFYESQNPRRQTMEYTPSQIVGEVGMASARAAPTADELLDRSSLTRNSLTSPQSLNPGTTQAEKNYELKENNSMQVKRRKELY